MERKYIILRKNEQLEGMKQFFHTGTGVTAKGAGFAAKGISAPPEIEFQKMQPRHAEDLSRAPEIEAIVPELPLKLIAPMPRSAAEEEAESRASAWGIEVLGASDTPFDGADIKMAVLDTGIDKNHCAFHGVELTEVDYTGEGNGDQDGHGTHCAGTIFGRDVNGIRIGVARGVTQAFIGKVIGRRGGETGALLKAIHEASEVGCQIISMSLGFDFPGAAARLIHDEDVPEDLAAAIALADYRANIRLFDRIGELMEAQSFISRHELLMFAASGNESKRDINPQYEMPAAPPSEAEGFNSVGALGKREDGKLYVPPFSNTSCNICAPGVGILSAKANSTDGLIAMSGTSMATPHMAGIAALHAQKEAASSTKTSIFRSQRNSLLYLLMGSASRRMLAPGLYTDAQVGLGMVEAPREER